MSQQLPPFACIIIHEVEDFDKWKPGFEAHQQARVDAGALGHHINRGVDNPNLLAVYIAASDKDKMVAMLSGDDVRAKMKSAGVKGTPDIKIMKPVLAEAIMDRKLPGMMVMHKVSDFAKWRAVYDGFDAKRKGLGIIGHAVNQLADDPNTLVVYNQAESLDALKKFAESPELKAAMQEAGVSSAPEISYWTADAGATY